MSSHDNMWYLQNRSAVPDLQSRAADLRNEARLMMSQANHLDKVAEELLKANVTFEGKAIHVNNVGTDQWYLQSLPAERSAIIYKDRTRDDGLWSGVLEDDQKNKTSLEPNTSEEIARLAKSWVAHAKTPEYIEGSDS